MSEYWRCLGSQRRAGWVVGSDMDSGSAVRRIGIGSVWGLAFEERVQVKVE